MKQKPSARYQVTVEHRPETDEWTWFRTFKKDRASLEGFILPDWLLQMIIDRNRSKEALRKMEFQVWDIIARAKLPGVLYCHDEHGEILHAERLEPVHVPIGDVTLYFRDIEQLLEVYG